jgi:hypothetical protein
MKSLSVLLASGFANFDNEGMALLIRLLHKYPNIVSVNLGELGHPRLDWWVFVRFLKSQALGGGVVAIFIDSNKASSSTVRSAKAAIRAHRQGCETEAKRLLQGGAEQDRAKAALMVPWRTKKFNETMASSGLGANLWWGKPFWYPRGQWEQL